MTKCKKCNKPVIIIKFTRVVSEKGILFYNPEIKDVEHKDRDREQQNIIYRCSNCNTILAASKIQALNLLYREDNTLKI